MENIRGVSDPRASAAEVDFVRDGLSLFNVAATGDSYYSPLTTLDAWLRVHRRPGAETLRLMPEALTVVGTVAEWEEWTGTVLLESGCHVVPGALRPVVIDRERDLGRYDDPNIWMRHPVR